MSTAAIEIHSLVRQNLELFGMEQAADSPHWLNYVGYVDNIICESLLKTVGCRYMLFCFFVICSSLYETYARVAFLQGSAIFKDFSWT
jgi:hypothetical protein